MISILHNPICFQILSILGGGLAVIGSLISALAYRGKNNEKYSPLNHFISELGEVGVSRLAWVFNLSLILCGFFLIPACIILGLSLPGFLSILGLVAGVITAISLSFVGVFPMNNLKPHGIAAITFFRSGLLMVLAFSMAIAFQPPALQVIARSYFLAGLPAIFAFGSFLIMMHKVSLQDKEPLQPEPSDRPKVWTLPIVEWTIFLTILLWFLLISFGI